MNYAVLLLLFISAVYGKVISGITTTRSTSIPIEGKDMILSYSIKSLNATMIDVMVMPYPQYSNYQLNLTFEYYEYLSALNTINATLDSVDVSFEEVSNVIAIVARNETTIKYEIKYEAPPTREENIVSIIIMVSSAIILILLALFIYMYRKKKV